MSVETKDINSVEVTFDKSKTKEYRTDVNKPCDCQDCRNYYKHIEKNHELIEFLNSFGIDYDCTEDVFSWDLENDPDSLIRHEGYYGVFGNFEGEGFEFEKFGVKITFAKGATIPCDRQGEYFWICIGGDFPYILDEERDFPIAFSETTKELCQLLFHKTTEKLNIGKKIFSTILFVTSILLSLFDIGFCVYGIIDINKTTAKLANTPGTSGIDYFGTGWVLGIGLFLLSAFGLLLSIISAKISQKKVFVCISYIMIILFSVLLILGIVSFYI